MYNLIEYSENYSETSERLWQFIRDQTPVTASGNPKNVSTANSTEAAENGVFENAKIAVKLKHLSKLWKSLEMPLINCKIHLELNWTKDCVMSAIADTKFKITNTNKHIRIVTLSSKDNVKLAKQLNEGFKRPVYWNAYIAIITEIITIIQDLSLMLLFKELKDCLFLLLITRLLMFPIIKLTIPTMEF